MNSSKQFLFFLVISLCYAIICISCGTTTTTVTTASGVQQRIVLDISSSSNLANPREIISFKFNNQQLFYGYTTVSLAQTGIIFYLNIDQTNYTQSNAVTIIDSTTIGEVPRYLLASQHTTTTPKLYGFSNSKIFSLTANSPSDPSTMTYRTELDLTTTIRNASTIVGLLEDSSNGVLYGLANTRVGYGEVFALIIDATDANNNIYTTLLTLEDGSNNQPRNPKLITLVGSKLYVISAAGASLASNQCGPDGGVQSTGCPILFSLNKLDGSSLTNLYYFVNNKGPTALLADSTNNILYGAMQDGGPFYLNGLEGGSIWKYTISTSTLEFLKHFKQSVDADAPTSLSLISTGALIGTTLTTRDSSTKGALFSLSTNANNDGSYHLIYEFPIDDSRGSTPSSFIEYSLTVAGNHTSLLLFGSTVNGGGSSTPAGTIYSIVLSCPDASTFNTASLNCYSLQTNNTHDSGAHSLYSNGRNYSTLLFNLIVSLILVLFININVLQ